MTTTAERRMRAYGIDKSLLQMWNVWSRERITYGQHLMWWNEEIDPECRHYLFI